MSVTVKETGVNMEQALERLPLEVRDKAVKAAGRKAGNVVRDSMRQRVAVDSGRTKRSIKTVVRDYGEKTMVYIGPAIDKSASAEQQKRDAIRVNVLEHGSIHQPPRPFIRPAGDETLRQQSEAIDEELNRHIERVLGG